MSAWFAAYLQPTDWTSIIGPSDLHEPEEARAAFDQMLHDSTTTDDPGAYVSRGFDDWHRWVAQFDSKWEAYGKRDPRSVTNDDADDYGWAFGPTAWVGFAHQRTVGHVIGYSGRVEWKAHVQTLPTSGYILSGDLIHDEDDPSIDVSTWTRDAEAIANRVEYTSMPGWSPFSACPNPPMQDLICIENKWGWPFASFYDHEWATVSGHYPSSKPRIYRPLSDDDDRNLPRHAIAVAFRDGESALPTGIIWLGLLLNALCYTITLMVARQTVRCAIRWSRHHRQRCPFCGHRRDPARLKADCPECGRG